MLSIEISHGILRLEAHHLFIILSALICLAELLKLKKREVRMNLNLWNSLWMCQTRKAAVKQRKSERVAVRDWPVTAEWLQCRVVPVCHHTSLCLSVPSTTPQVPPSFPSLVISQDAGMGTARGEVPMRLKLRACLSPFSLFFLLEVEHHQGVRFTAINCCLIPKRQRMHTLTRLILRKKKHKFVFLLELITHMQTRE